MSTDTNPDLIMCGTCGDEFTQHDRGTCGNCMAGETAALHVEIERLTAERDALRAYRVLRASVEAMMAPLGYHGEISARDDRVQAVMDALAQIDAEDRT